MTPLIVQLQAMLVFLARTARPAMPRAAIARRRGRLFPWRAAAISAALTVMTTAGPTAMAGDLAVNLTSYQQTVAAGQAASFLVQGAWQTAPEFRWQRMPAGSSTWQDVADIPPFSGATSWNLNVDPTNRDLNGDQFRAYVRIGADSGYSAPATLTVNATVAPKITNWQANDAGSRDTSKGTAMSGVVTGTWPMDIRWYKDDVLYLERLRTNYPAYLGLDSSLGPAMAGTYRMEVTNAAGTAVSPDARIEWLPRETAWFDVKWKGGKRVGNMVYFLTVTPAQILRYDLSAQAWLAPVALRTDKEATAFEPTPEGIFIAYDKELAYRPLDLSTETVIKTSMSTIGRLYAVQDHIWFAKGGAIGRINRSTRLDYFDLSDNRFLNGNGAVYLPTMDHFVMATSGDQLWSAKPGVNSFLEWQESNGSMPWSDLGLGLFASPDGSKLFAGSGSVFAASSLAGIGSLGHSFDDIAFLDDGTVVALAGRRLAAYRGSDLAYLGERMLERAGVAMVRDGASLVIFGVPTATTSSGSPDVQRVDAGGFTAPVIAAVADPKLRRFTLDDMFLSADKVLYVLSRSEHGLVRWDTQSRAFLGTIPLRGRPSALGYDPLIDRATLAYGDGTLTDLFPSTSPVEETFGRYPGEVVPSRIFTLGNLIALDFSRSSGTSEAALIVGAAGEYLGGRRTSLANGNFTVWVPATRRLYLTNPTRYDFAYTGYVEISEAGEFGTQSERIDPEIWGKVMPRADGGLLLTAGGQVINAATQVAAQLPNPVLDGIWTTDGLCTIRPLENGDTEVEKWAPITYAKSAGLTVRGLPERIFQLDPQRFLVVTTSNGYLTFHLVGATLAASETTSNDPAYVPYRPAFFDPERYLAQNPDVAALIGQRLDRGDRAWAHYYLYGLFEGRTDGDFNAQAYLAQYPNLAAELGGDLKAAALHWYTTGRAQGLRIPAGFDVPGYLARNADIAALFSNDKYGAWLHYYNFGLFEGRSFDANFIPAEYLELNQDLKTVFGSNLQAAVMHWFNYGHPIEDRMGRVPIGFNVDSYLARYPDLAAVFGGITPTAVRNVTVWHHYLAYGTLEGRSDGDFEAYHYLATNPDLAGIFGSDIQAAALHWYFYGRREGRRIPGGFNVQNYRALYPDVVLVFGDDLYGSWLHYRDNGVFEGRIYDDLFRPADYLNLNPDVAAAIGTNFRDALLHWLFYGQYEGRSGKL